MASRRAPSSRLHCAALEREHSARALLDEQDDEDEDGDLAEHGACVRLEELVGDAERERADQSAPQIADAAEHDDHERVDDVTLAEVWTDIVDLRQRYARDAGNPGS